MAELKPSPKNPRKVTKAKLKQLERSMDQFGDLSGVVFDTRSNTLVSGHQRLEAIKQAGGTATVVITTTYNDGERGESEHGTLAEGYIEHAGARYAYREVNWAPYQADLARIAANKQAGSFDAVQLANTMQTLSKANLDLSLTMFDAEELRSYLPDTAILQRTEDAAAVLEEAEGSPSRVRGATQAGDAPHADAPEEPGIKPVALYFRAPDHAKFVEMVDALKDIYHRTNTSDVVLEAIKRASVQAAFR